MGRVAWGLTGAGHFLPEVVALLDKKKGVDIFLSHAAVEVLKMYGLWDTLPVEGRGLYLDRSASSPVVGKFYTGYYQVLVVAPATSNSVAKFVLGISDNLITNLFAHAGKAMVPIIVLPCDGAGEIESMAPREKVKVYPRPVDMENIAKLSRFTGVTVVQNMEELEACLSIYL